MADNVFGFVQAAINNLISGSIQGSILDSASIAVRAVAVILLMFYGARTMLAPGSFSVDGLVSVVVKIFIVLTVVKYYTTPIPGLNTTITGFPMKLASELSAMFTGTTYKDIYTTCKSFTDNLPAPKVTDVVTSFWVVFCMIIIYTVEAITFLVASFGIIMSNILVLLGPVFIPFYVVPEFEFLFWGWFKSFLQYSFYSVMAGAYTWIIAKLMGSVFSAILSKYTSANQSWSWSAAIPLLLWLLLISVIGVILIPVTTSSLFSGSSGESSLPKGGNNAAGSGGAQSAGSAAQAASTGASSAEAAATAATAV